jgi:hypothetical protein
MVPAGYRENIMPGFNGTGPAGEGPMTGRGFGRCRFGPVRRESVTPPEQTQEAGAPQEVQLAQQPQETVPPVPVYGVGRGGIPWGCGRGRNFGGGRRVRWL